MMLQRSPRATRRACIAYALTALLLLVSSAQAATRSPVDAVIGAACDKQVVLLGELPSHGEAKTFAAKAQIVRRLVDDCGFDTVLFEAPLYEFELRRDLPDPDGLDRAIGRFWMSRELAPWRAWLLDRESAGKIRMGGLDDQISDTSALTVRALPGLVARAASGMDAGVCRTSVQRHLEWEYTAWAPFDAQAKRMLAMCARRATLPDRPVGTPQAAMLAAFERYTARQSGFGNAPSRDDSMFEAWAWHVNTSPRPRRVVVWTASVHAAREPGARSYVPLGYRLAQRLGERLLAVGFTAAGGTSAMVGTKSNKLDPMPPDSLEMAALGATDEAIYLDAKALQGLDGRLSRLYGTPASHAWSRHFDGVVVFRQEDAPTFPAESQPP